MIDLTLNSFLHPDLVGLKPPFGTIIERTVENKGGLSTAQTDNNMAMPFALMRPVTVATSDTTSKVEYDAKLLLTGDTPLTIHLDDAAYEGCTVTIVNGCAAQATLVAVGKLNGTDTGTFKLAIGRVAVITWRFGWITLQETTSEGAFSAPPLGFIYPQFSGENAPNALFPGTTWENISNQHAGRFFRAEGTVSCTYGSTTYSNAAVAFGSVQNASLPNITGTTAGCDDNSGSWSGAFALGGYTGNTSGDMAGTYGSFNASRSNQVYGAVAENNSVATLPIPPNETIRIWKRIG